mmetsp:Transcript_14451/g.22730  ORF Transcript_14451/g.22730 Transcript_14451/m.22730 type:complete len:295 (+) Transcript_14451:19-903(+)|eukprot:CAMPEP_0117033580 /NCGR_PEP_ID=MMETSP0472-20121206/23976_1 /TAXON_ID=693140 ORGANISM="Tiarina fusus, Strain LIS" /NCGR_SAMPLE_ID=MMETSP0472 /ASSEMBLY_ACC=CAM_ASM_000603 /LENGTH=294 /DNA_ID=CAMNT_0004742523 /DNA_START=14 /DNA_END=898 /DNA_ORIENTATION=-
MPLLVDTKVSDLLNSDAPIHTVGKKESVKKIYNILTEQKILSVPVYDNKSGKYKTFIDILDLLVYSVEVIGDDAIAAGYETFSSHEKFVASCAELADRSHRNPFIGIDENSPLELAIERMNKNKVHRLATLNSAGELCDLISQSEIVRFLSSHLDEFPVSTKTVEELSLGYREVISVPLNKTAFYAFEQIVKHKISGIGITNDDGLLIGNLSASDLKKFGYDNYLLSNMFLPLHKFLVLDKDNEMLPPILTVKPSNTVGEVIQEFCKHRVHRLYVLDGSEQKGVITLGDILSLF